MANNEKPGETQTAETVDEVPNKGQEQKDDTSKNADVVTRLIEAVIPLADKYLTYKDNEAKAEKEYFERVSHHNRRMVYVLVLFLAVIIALMSVLTYFKLVSGDALLFLVGTVTGYLLLFIQRLVFPSEEPRKQEVPT